MKKTPWFDGDVKPARVGIYEIDGARFEAPNFRYWNGLGWSATHSDPSEFDEGDHSAIYTPGEDMTGWRGLTKEAK